MKRIHIFDLDGTLADSMHVWVKGMLQLFTDRKIPYPKDVMEKAIPMNRYEKFNYFNSFGLGLQSVGDMMEELGSGVIPKYHTEVFLKKGVKEYLQKCKEAGDKLYILSASPHEAIDPCLKLNGVYDLFDGVFSSDDFGISKSKVALFEKVAEFIGCKKEEIVFYDDNLTVIQTVKKAGLYAVGVYDEQSAVFEGEIKDTADKYIRSFEELL